ncbi:MULTISPECIES: SDR family NAD(P)-dependent oxidoreductase [Limnobacter]|uniref:3-oxoacyl-ACP reductase n=1 Tax=Limnobacter litoralis TaxID=481366 RepID=A0ABQ5YXM7_9BURK|nr:MULTISPECIES: SDR family oxidoreductase [Limnobacter]GLR27484.1 3-oxoacyl-ACP reductase [Limnobacter litoralis]HEX5487024.1 SDR family oxidoreductase [Limnobacter sp.]
MNAERKVAVVTGGGTGIGRATCIRLAQTGCDVALIYSRSAEQADQTMHDVVQLGRQAMAIRADVSDKAQVNAAFEQVILQWGQLNYLVNNAAITRQLPFNDLDLVTDEIWDVLLSVNLKGSFNCSHAAAPHLRKQAGSAIVNVGSIAGETGFGSSLPYAVSKAAVHGLTRSLARALAPSIRVNCIAPGAVDTRWWVGHEDKMRQISGTLPLERISTPEDIAEAICFLLTAPSLTGQVIKAENGQTL